MHSKYAPCPSHNTFPGLLFLLALSYIRFAQIPLGLTSTLGMLPGSRWSSGGIHHYWSGDHCNLCVYVIMKEVFRSFLLYILVFFFRYYLRHSKFKFRVRYVFRLLVIKQVR